MSRYRRALERLARQKWFGDFNAVFLYRVDRALYGLSGGRMSLLHVGSRHVLPTMLLTTAGRKSGKRRTAPVVYLEEGDSLFVLASNYGRDNHPAWSLNLLENPDAEVQVDRERRRVRARRATEEEKQRMWQRQLEVWPPWQAYRERTPREFRAFFLEPAEG
jgi:deazaflavin-dependent oxidoreductase (nitroreductase family)